MYNRLKPHKLRPLPLYILECQCSSLPLATFSGCSPAACVLSARKTCMISSRFVFKADFFPKVLINTHIWRTIALFSLASRIWTPASRTRGTRVTLASNIKVGRERHCMFNTSSYGVWWIIGSTTVNNVDILLSAITLFEFVCAQSPHPLCGLSTGFVIMFSSLSAFIGYGIFRLAVIIVSNAHSWFYSNLSIALLIFVYFIFFHCIAKQYKLRKRDDIVPIHLFALYE